MLQIKTGQESPVRTVLGPNCRPPNNSHFRNLKCLKIDQVVSQKKGGGKGRKGKKGKKPHAPDWYGLTVEHQTRN